jgi:hypothetical protein
VARASDGPAGAVFTKDAQRASLAGRVRQQSGADVVRLFRRVPRSRVRLAALLSSLTLFAPDLARAGILLPSQEDANIFSRAICLDRKVVSAIKSTADRILKTNVVIAKGMQADDIHMDGVYVDERLVYCSMTMSANRITDNVRYIIGVKDNAYVIILGGNSGSRLFPDEVVIRSLKDDG